MRHTKRSHSLVALVNELRSGLERGEDQSLLRVAADWYGRTLRAEHDLEVVLMNDPGSCGDQRWDALVAGLVERVARLRGMRVPAWVSDPDRYLAQWWFLVPYRSLHASVLVGNVPELANRGVFLHEASLESV